MLIPPSTFIAPTVVVTPQRSGLLIAQEALELRSELVARRHATGAEQIRLVLGLVVELFQLGDHRLMFFVAGDELVESLPLDDALLTNGRRIDDQPGEVVQTVQQCER